MNLIGEHTDYNDGFVLPMAIERYVAVAFAPQTDPAATIHSGHFGESVSFRPDRLEPGSVAGWGAYAAGMCWAMKQRGYPVGGLRAAISTNIPIGAGVSSSAAFEVSFGLALATANRLDLSPLQIAELSHVADNEYVGIPSGIMDQYASALCREGHALLIDCRSLDSTSVPVPAGVRFVVMDTAKRRGLVDSLYSERVAACRRVVSAVRRIRPEVSALRDVGRDELERVRGAVSDVDLRRAAHVLDENERTVRAADLLATQDVPGFGAAMVASHESLRDQYEVSCLELDAMVDLALDQTECFGARMTGGGFGGCAIALVDATKVDGFIANVGPAYRARTGRDGSLFSVEPSNGVRLVEA